MAVLDGVKGRPETDDLRRSSLPPEWDPRGGERPAEPRTRAKSLGVGQPFEAERSRTELSRLGSSLPPRGGPFASERPASPTAELLASVRRVRQRFRDVTNVFDSLTAMRSLGGEEALIEMALFAQSHERTIEEMWRALTACEQAALAIAPDSPRSTLPPGLDRSTEASGLSASIVPTGPVVSPTPPPVPTAALTSPHADDDESPITQVDITPSRVLLVDDDPTVLRAFRRVLQHDHDVLTARDGAEALRVVLSGAALDAIICDLGMPKLDGPTFFSELLELRPQMVARVVFCTGGMPSDKIQRFLDRLQAPVLHKPVAAADLLRAIESVRAQ